jgi:hypothetical protein
MLGGVLAGITREYVCGAHRPQYYRQALNEYSARCRRTSIGHFTLGVPLRWQHGAPLPGAGVAVVITDIQFACTDTLSMTLASVLFEPAQHPLSSVAQSTPLGVRNRHCLSSRRRRRPSKDRRVGAGFGWRQRRRPSVPLSSSSL